jgi:putative membrane protein insertion efficiency factor
VRYLGVALVWAYRVTLGPFLAGQGQCKYHPSCSQYAIDAYREFGLLKGTVLAGWRLLRCNPWSRGGVDYARDQRVFSPRRRLRCRPQDGRTCSPVRLLRRPTTPGSGGAP